MLASLSMRLNSGPGPARGSPRVKRGKGRAVRGLLRDHRVGQMEG